MNKVVSIFSMSLLYASSVGAQNLVFEQGFENHPDAVEVLSLTATPATIYEGALSTIEWEIKDADGCITSDGTAEWQALTPNENVANGNFEVTTLNSAGNYPFTLTCTGAIGDPSAMTTNIVVETPPPVNILSFEADPSTIMEDESVTLSWTLEDATDCTATGGSNQWQALNLDGNNNSAEITDLDTAGVYQFGLSCEGIGGDEDVASVDVTVEAPPACEPPTLDGSNFYWNDFFSTPNGQEFPRVGLSRVTWLVASRRYMSIQFNTGNASNHGQFSLINHSQSSGLRLGAISTCEGNFDVNPKCTHSWGTGKGIKWETDGEPNSCELEPNTTYFLNFTYTDGVDPDSSRCNLDVSGKCYLVIDTYYQ